MLKLFLDWPWRTCLFAVYYATPVEYFFWDSEHPLEFNVKPLGRNAFVTMGLTTLQPLAYAVAYVTFFLGTTSVFLRFYCRHFVLRTRGWDDNFAILILVCAYALEYIYVISIDWKCSCLALDNKLSCTCSCIGDVDYTWKRWAVSNSSKLSRYGLIRDFHLDWAEQTTVAIHRRSGLLLSSLGNQIGFPPLLPAPLPK